MAVMTLVVLEAIMNYGSHYLKCKKKIIESAINEMQIFWRGKANSTIQATSLSSFHHIRQHKNWVLDLNKSSLNNWLAGTAAACINVQLGYSAIALPFAIEYWHCCCRWDRKCGKA
jgi:hypothetical protein